MNTDDKISLTEAQRLADEFADAKRAFNDATLAAVAAGLSVSAEIHEMKIPHGRGLYPYIFATAMISPGKVTA